jgi:hypothetical protein
VVSRVPLHRHSQRADFLDAFRLPNGNRVDFSHPIFYLFSFLCSSICIVMWLGALVMVMRLSAQWTVASLQSRLLTWANEQGYKIFHQELPARNTLAQRVFGSGPWTWLLSSGEPPWYFDLFRRSFWTTVPRFSTYLSVEDSAGHPRRGWMQYIGSRMGGFWWSVESRWQEDDDVPPLPEPMPPAPQDDPLWDRWIDSSGT